MVGLRTYRHPGTLSGSMIMSCKSVILRINSLQWLLTILQTLVNTAIKSFHMSGISCVIECLLSFREGLPPPRVRLGT